MAVKSGQILPQLRPMRISISCRPNQEPNHRHELATRLH
jgi:hypothetical protein